MMARKSEGGKAFHLMSYELERLRCQVKEGTKGKRRENRLCLLSFVDLRFPHRPEANRRPPASQIIPFLFAQHKTPHGTTSRLALSVSLSHAAYYCSDSIRLSVNQVFINQLHHRDVQAS